MRTFVISLKSAESRRESITRQFAYLGLEFEFFDAISADEHPQTEFGRLDRDTFRLNTYRSPLATEIACYASHRALWNHTIKMREPIIILEDDAQLSVSFAAAAEITRNLINAFGFIRLQPYKRVRKLRLGTETHDLMHVDGHLLYYVSKVPVCLLAYAISPAAAAKLVRASTTFDSPVDKFVQRTWEHETPIFGLEPAPVSVSGHAFRSTIGSRAEKSKDAITMLRRGWYKLMGEIRQKRFDKLQLKRFGKSPPFLISQAETTKKRKACLRMRRIVRSATSNRYRTIPKECSNEEDSCPWFDRRSHAGLFGIRHTGRRQR